MTAIITTSEERLAFIATLTNKKRILLWI